MNKGKMMFIAEYCGWIVNDNTDTLVLEYQSGNDSCWHDRNHKMDPVVYRISGNMASVYDIIMNEAETFDASRFAFEAAKQYENKYNSTPPLITICDFAKDISSRLACLNIILGNNIAMDDFEKKLDNVSSGYGFQFVIERKRTSDLLVFQNGDEKFLTSVKKICSDDLSGCQYPSKEKRIRKILDDINEDIMFSKADSERKKNGDALIAALSAEFDVSGPEAVFMGETS